VILTDVYGNAGGGAAVTCYLQEQRVPDVPCGQNIIDKTNKHRTIVGAVCNRTLLVDRERAVKNRTYECLAFIWFVY
jgi:hypothetical protein